LLLFMRGVTGEDLVDFGVDHITHAAHRRIVGED
jgi:hypothetical protein